jgi:hypothetical protein
MTAEQPAICTMMYHERKDGWAMEGYIATFTQSDFEAELAAANAGIKTCPTRDLVQRRVATMPLSEAINIKHNGSLVSNRELALPDGLEEVSPVAAE